MHCPTLKKLPPPPLNKTGWPWTEESIPLPEVMSDGSRWPKLSVVVPTYNQGSYIEQTIRSVLLQGYPNYEYIIIDDGSTDNTPQILKKYETFITYSIRQDNRGAASALNRALQIVTGDWIAWQDSDDYYPSNHFRIFAENLKNLNNADIVYGAIECINEENKFLRNYPVINPFTIENLLPYPQIGHQSLFFKRKIFDESNFFNETFYHVMDLDFFLRLALKGYRFCFLKGMLGYYRTHPASMSSTQFWVQEGSRIYTGLLSNPTISLSLRKKVIQSIRWSCLSCFGSFKLDLFRKVVRNTVIHIGIKETGLEILAKYLLSFLGENIIRQFKSIKTNYAYWVQMVTQYRMKLFGNYRKRNDT